MSNDRGEKADRKRRKLLSGIPDSTREIMGRLVRTPPKPHKDDKAGKKPRRNASGETRRDTKSS